MKKLSMLLVLIIILTIFSGCNSGGNDFEKLTMVLDWTPNTNHTGIYMAKALGYYEEMGIDLEILQPPESGAPALVASGNAEFGISFQDELGPAFALETPLPITAIAGIIAHNTSGFISSVDAGIKSPKDFENKKVIVWDTPILREIIRDLVESDGGDFGKVELIVNNVSDPVLLLQEPDTVLWGYYAWDLTNIRLAGLEVDYLPMVEYSSVFDYYTPVIIANNSYIEKNPEITQKFINATAKGYKYAIDNPVESAEKLVEMVPELELELILESQKYLAGEYLSDSPRWGEIDSERWNAFFDWMYEKNVLERPVEVVGFTNKFLP